MLFDILFKITLPVFILIGVGILVDRVWEINLSTLTRLSFNVFMPALVFIKTLDAGLSPSLFGSITLINLIHTVILIGIAWAVFSLPAFKTRRPVLSLASLLPNCGNYGIPLATLAFGAAGTNIMAIIVMLQIMLTVTLGLLIINSGKAHWKDVVSGIFKVPVLWVVIAALVFVALKIELPTPLRAPIEYLADAMVAVALLTLGIQLSRSRFTGQVKPLLLVGIMRLFLAPILALGIVWAWEVLFGVDLGVAGPVMVIGAGMPVAVNVFILAAEYDQDTEQASQAIFWTTIVSALTLTVWLAILH